MVTRNRDLNIIPNAISTFSKEEILEIYRQMSRIRKFEECIVSIVDSGKGDIFHVKVHLSTGQEAVASALGLAAHNYQFFTQHRSMDTYLVLGGPPEKLRDEILCLDTGCAGGRIGGSFNFFGNGTAMFGHTGFIGENVSVGVGAALGSGKKTACIFGDGAAEEDYVLEAMGFAATHKLPVLFVCNDNVLSVLSPLEKRRTWKLAEVARAFGIESVDVADDPFTLVNYIRKFDNALPALINCNVNRNYWHAGTGVDGPPDWDRYIMLKEKMTEMGYENEIQKIEQNAEEEMKQVWRNYL